MSGEDEVPLQQDKKIWISTALPWSCTYKTPKNQDSKMFKT